MPLPLNWYTLNETFADIGTAETLVFVAPVAGFLRKVQTVLQGAITGADDTVTVSIDGVALSPTITITQSGSAAGDVDYAEYYAAVKEGSRITVATAGSSTGPQKAGVTLTLSG